MYVLSLLSPLLHNPLLLNIFIILCYYPLSVCSFSLLLNHTFSKQLVVILITHYTNDISYLHVFNYVHPFVIPSLPPFSLRLSLQILPLYYKPINYNKTHISYIDVQTTGITTLPSKQQTTPRYQIVHWKWIYKNNTIKPIIYNLSIQLNQHTTNLPIQIEPCLPTYL